MIADNPVKGVGLGNYMLHSWDYLTYEERHHFLASVYALLVHNSFLLFTAEMGYPGGFLLAFWYIVILFTAIRILRSRLNHPLITNVTLGIIAGVIAMILYLMSSPDIHEYSLLYQLTLFCGILMAEQNILNQAERKKRIKPRIQSPSNSPVHPASDMQ